VTKSSGLVPAARPCAEQVQYGDRSGPCKHDGKYPDPDGVRWWCGIHFHKRAKAQPAAQESVSPVDKDILVGIKHRDDDEREEMLAALHEARMVLMELSTMRDAGWPPTTPVEKYKIMMTHMADRAKEAMHSLNEKISRFRT